MTQSPSEQRFTAYVLLTIGGLMTVLCGGCTATFLGPAIWTLVAPYFHHGAAVDEEASNVAPAVIIGALFIGVLPTAAGVLLFVQGLRRFRESSRRANESQLNE